MQCVLITMVTVEVRDLEPVHLLCACDKHSACRALVRLRPRTLPRFHILQAKWQQARWQYVIRWIMLKTFIISHAGDDQSYQSLVHVHVCRAVNACLAAGALIPSHPPACCRLRLPPTSVSCLGLAWTRAPGGCICPQVRLCNCHLPMNLVGRA